MGNSLKELLSELEACRGESAASKLLVCDTPHTLLMPIDLQTCHELKALAQVFDCEPPHLALLIMKAALVEIHAGLDDDLARLALEARHTMGESCSTAA